MLKTNTDTKQLSTRSFLTYFDEFPVNTRQRNSKCRPAWEASVWHPANEKSVGYSGSSKAQAASLPSIEHDSEHNFFLHMLLLEVGMFVRCCLDELEQPSDDMTDFAILH
jgi:hypothetical protein